jgi:hypothetical protein
MTRTDTFAGVHALLGSEPLLSRLAACTLGTLKVAISTALALFVGIQIEYAIQTLAWM